MAYPEYGPGQVDKVQGLGMVAYGGDGTNFYPVKVNSSGNLEVGHDKTGIGHGVTTSTSVATAVVLAASTTAKVVTVQAQTDNTGAVAVGGSGVLATVATGTGVLLYAGDSITLEIDNLNDVYFDVTVSGEGVRYTYLT